MSTFSNNFGKVLLENNIFEINLGNISKAIDLEEFISKMKQYYTGIDQNFIMICDFSNINILDVNSKLCHQIADIFVENYLISETHLKHLVIITKSTTIKNILNSFFYLYHMPHPVSIFKNKSIKFQSLLEKIKNIC